jgi:hypothetical protein
MKNSLSVFQNADFSLSPSRDRRLFLAPYHERAEFLEVPLNNYGPQKFLTLMLAYS